MSFHRQNGSTGSNGGIGSKVDNFFDKRELPMYKDKPYSYAASRKNTPLYRQWRVIAGGILSLMALLYWLSTFDSTSAGKPGIGGKTEMLSSWSWTGGPDVAVDWNSRREAVKEAFILSWDGYEQYAWGMSEKGRNAILSFCRVIVN